ncbi:unnamed protein product, partial [Ectocarpus sp. 12 AP-2014]
FGARCYFPLTVSLSCLLIWLHVLISIYSRYIYLWSSLLFSAHRFSLMPSHFASGSFITSCSFARNLSPFHTRHIISCQSLSPLSYTDLSSALVTTTTTTTTAACSSLSHVPRQYIVHSRFPSHALSRSLEEPFVAFLCSPSTAHTYIHTSSPVVSLLPDMSDF